MKALCLLLILANVSLFLWEYREGGFNHQKEPSTQAPNPDLERIFLANEVEQDSELVAPNGNQAEQGVDSRSADIKNTLLQSEPPETLPPSKTNTLNQTSVPVPKIGKGDTGPP